MHQLLKSNLQMQITRLSRMGNPRAAFVEPSFLSHSYSQVYAVNGSEDARYAHCVRQRLLPRSLQTYRISAFNESTVACFHVLWISVGRYGQIFLIQIIKYNLSSILYYSTLCSSSNKTVFHVPLGSAKFVNTF